MLRCISLATCPAFFSEGYSGSPVSSTPPGECNAITKRWVGESDLTSSNFGGEIGDFYETTVGRSQFALVKHRYGGGYCPRSSSRNDAAAVSTDEDYAIFAAAIGHFYVGQVVRVLLLDQTSIGFPPGLAGTTGDGNNVQAFFKRVPADVKDNFDSRNKIPTKIAPVKIKGPFELVSLGEEHAKNLIERKGGWEAFHQKYPGMPGVMVVSRPGINREADRAVLYVGTSCGRMCGGGALLFLSKESGEWKIVNKDTVWTS